MYIKTEKGLLLSLKNVIEITTLYGEESASICAKCRGISKPVFMFKDKEKKEIKEIFARLVYATGFIPVNDTLINPDCITTVYLAETESGYRVIATIVGHECDTKFCVATMETEEEAQNIINRICGKITTV